MDIIDGEWIKARLTGKRGQKAALARFVGMNTDVLSKVLSGVRSLNSHEIPRVVEFFSDDPSAPNDGAPRALSDRDRQILALANQLTDSQFAQLVGYGEALGSQGQKSNSKSSRETK